MSLVTVGEAADRLKVSTQTVKRRLKTGSLHGQREETPQGYIWLVDILDDFEEPNVDTATFPDDTSATISADISREIKRMEEMIAMLQTELDRRDRQIGTKDDQIETKDKQIGELHILLQQSQAALPAARDDRTWWRFWER